MNSESFALSNILFENTQSDSKAMPDYGTVMKFCTEELKERKNGIRTSTTNPIKQIIVRYGTVRMVRTSVVMFVENFYVKQIVCVASNLLIVYRNESGMIF